MVKNILKVKTESVDWNDMIDDYYSSNNDEKFGSPIALSSQKDTNVLNVALAEQQKLIMNKCSNSDIGDDSNKNGGKDVNTSDILLDRVHDNNLNNITVIYNVNNNYDNIDDPAITTKSIVKHNVENSINEIKSGVINNNNTFIMDNVKNKNLKLPENIVPANTTDFHESNITNTNKMLNNNFINQKCYLKYIKSLLMNIFNWKNDYSMIFIAFDTDVNNKDKIISMTIRNCISSKTYWFLNDLDLINIYNNNKHLNQNTINSLKRFEFPSQAIVDFVNTNLIIKPNFIILSDIESVVRKNQIFGKERVHYENCQCYFLNCKNKGSFVYKASDNECYYVCNTHVSDIHDPLVKRVMVCNNPYIIHNLEIKILFSHIYVQAKFIKPHNMTLPNRTRIVINKFVHNRNFNGPLDYLVFNNSDTGISNNILNHLCSNDATFNNADVNDTVYTWMKFQDAHDVNKIHNCSFQHYDKDILKNLLSNVVNYNNYNIDVKNDEHLNYNVYSKIILDKTTCLISAVGDAICIS